MNKKITSALIIILSVFGIIISFLIKNINVGIYKHLDLKTLFEILFGIGLFLFNFPKIELNKDAIVDNTKLIVNSYFLAALYTTFIAYSIIQNINKNYEINILIIPILFLGIQTIINTFFTFKKYSKKLFVVLINIIAILGILLLLLF